MSHAPGVSVVTGFSARDDGSAKRARACLPRISLSAACLLGLLFSGTALADSRSSLVFVSVRVVDSCRVNATEANNSVDVSMRCTSAARPSISMENQGALPGVSQAGLVGSLPVSSLSLARTGDQVLRIDF